MPIYEYRCRACGQDFDRMRSMAQADVPTPCPGCEADDTARLPSRIAARATSGSGLPMAGAPAPSAGGGGCCGGGCCG